MISGYRFIILLVFLIIVTVNCARIKDVIGFPELEENPLLVNKQDRIPVYLPSKCPENELYYPGDQTDDWICDCRAGYLFHPDSDKCWLAFERGPCPEDQHLILRNNSMIPVCVPNPCKADSFVLWNGNCSKLGDDSVCGDSYPTKQLWVNAVTLKVECVEVFVNNRFAGAVTYETPVIQCPRGCRRSIENKCMCTQPKCNPKSEAVANKESMFNRITSRVKGFFVIIKNSVYRLID